MTRRILHIGTLAVLCHWALVASPPVFGQPTGKDLYGDPLPKEALARLGSVRFHHPGGISAMAFSPESKQVLAGGWDSSDEKGTSLSLRFWETASGKELARFSVPGHPRSAGFTPDGKAVALGREEAIDLFDCQTGKLLRTFEGRHYNNSFVFSPDGRFLAAGSSDDGSKDNFPIRVWEVLTGAELPPFEGRGQVLCDIKFSADGKRLMTAAAERMFFTREGKKEVRTTIPGAICVWDVRTRKLLHEIPNHNTNVALSPDGQTVAQELTVNQNRGAGPILVTNVATKTQVCSIRGAYNGAFTFTPDGKSLITVVEGQEPRLWDAATGKEIRRYRVSANLRGIRLGGVSPDGKLLAVICGNWSQDGYVRLWDIQTGEEVSRGGGHQDEVTGLAYAPNGKMLASVGRDNAVRLWDPVSAKELRRLVGHTGEVLAVAFTHDGKMLASYGADGSTRIWDVVSGRQLTRLDSPSIDQRSFYRSQHSSCLAFSADSKSLTLSTGEGSQMTWGLSFWGALQGAKRLTIGNGETTVALSHHAGTILTATGDRGWGRWGNDEERVPERLALWNTATGKLRKAILLGDASDEYGSVVTWTAALSHDERFVASSQSRVTHGLRTQITGDCIRLWDVVTGQELLKTPVKVNAFAFSPSGRLLAMAQGGTYYRMSWTANNLSILDTLTGDTVCSLPGHPAQVNRIVFAPDGKTLATASADHSILIWKTPALKQTIAKAATAKDLQDCWIELASADAASAHRAVARLVVSPGPSVQLIRTRIKPRTAIDPKLITAYITDLDSDDFEVRDRAQTSLDAMEDLAEPALRAALKTAPSAEVRGRLSALLARRDELAPGQLRTVRALTVLEHINDADARALLQTLSQGVPEARLTRLAGESLRRMGNNEVIRNKNQP